MKLMNIKGYWDSSYKSNFNEQNIWEGEILLQEDGWFEGIVNNPNSSYVENRFIFGIYLQDKAIELFKMTPINIGLPLNYRVTKSNFGYDGIIEQVGYYTSTRFATSHIITEDSNLNLVNYNKAKEKLGNKIEAWKNDIMDNVTKSFYENTKSRKQVLFAIAAKNYWNKNSIKKRKKNSY